MQIPPSERQEVMKGIPLRTLLSELEKRRFTGYCAMPIAGASALLVLEEGKYVLAEYRGSRERMPSRASAPSATLRSMSSSPLRTGTRSPR